jgi:pimeloyl-ACP methyl ester carboxylesterase
VLTRAASVTVPTLVLGGADSPPFLRDMVDLAVRTVPGARHRLLDGQTHAVDVSVLAPVLTGFFTG